MVKELISYLRQTISSLNDLRYFGDVVVFNDDDWLGKGISSFTGNDFTHCALRTGKNSVEGVRVKYRNFIPFIAPEDVRVSHNLEDLPEECMEYKVLRHKEISFLKRLKMRRAYREMEIKEYDFNLFLKKALDYKLFRRGPDSRDLSRGGAYLCGSQTIYPLFKVIGLQLIKLNGSGREIHWSQMEPQHFLESENFQIVQEWSRNGSRKPSNS